MSDLGTTAAILLREHDNIAQAIRYAERKAQYLAAMGNAVGCDYALAAEQLRAYQAKQGEKHMTLLEVAKHALEAMEDAMDRADTHEFYDAKESLRYAIEQAEQAEQEPVAWRITDGEGDWEYRTDLPEDWSIQWSARYGRKYEPLFTAPTPQHDTDCHLQGICQRSGYSIANTPRRPLTDEEIDRVIERWWRDDLKMKYEELARAIERAHGIGEQT